MTNSRIPLGIVALGLTALLSACGGMPNDASVEDFCSAVDQMWEAEDDAEYELDMGILHDAADVLKQTGTPSAASDEVRDQLRTIVDIAQDSKSIDGYYNKVENSSDENNGFENLDDYESEVCSDYDF